MPPPSNVPPGIIVHCAKCRATAGSNDPKKAPPNGWTKEIEGKRYCPKCKRMAPKKGKLPNNKATKTCKIIFYKKFNRHLSRSFYRRRCCRFGNPRNADEQT